MSRCKTPQRKKAESYKHDRLEHGKYPHADRKNGPRQKARSQRALRRAAKRILSSQPEESAQTPGLGRPWLKTSKPLADHVAETARNRIEREAHNLFRKGYGPRTHGQFRRVFQSWMRGRSEHSAALADFYAEIVDSLGAWPPWHPCRKHLEFISQLFRNEPVLEKEFRAWIARFRQPAS
jgi:hypothetical protein